MKFVEVANKLLSKTKTREKTEKKQNEITQKIDYKEWG